MADVVDKFYARTHDKRINSCGGILGECVAGVQSYTNVELGIGGCPAFPVASAKDMFGTRTDAFDWVKNTPTGVPPRGAIVVWNGNTGGGHGHTGVVVEANVNTMRIYQQNDPKGSAMHVKTYDYKNVIGWGVPKGGQLGQEGDKATMNREAGIELYRTALHREPESQSVADQWNGRSIADALRIVRQSDEWKLTDSFTKDYPKLKADFVKIQTDFNGLQAENKTLKERVSELEKLVKQLQDQLAVQNQDNENLNKLGEVLQWFLSRIGLKK